VYFVAKIVLGYFHYLQMIEYCRLNIEELRVFFHFKKDGAKRPPQIFNLQSSIFNSGSSGLGLLLCIASILISCSALPSLQPADRAARVELPQTCHQLFPNGNWQFVHSIEAVMPGGHRGMVMGVTVISSRDKSAHCVLMTMEGLVVFDARYDQQLVINRAVAPFDHEGFAAGLISDIQLIFFMPEGPLVETGKDPNGASVCRYQNPDGRIVDLVIDADHTRHIRQYNSQQRLSRTVDAFSTKQESDGDGPDFPDRLELTTHGVADYTLIMDLVEAIPLTK